MGVGVDREADSCASRDGALDPVRTGGGGKGVAAALSAWVAAAADAADGGCLGVEVDGDCN